MNTYVLVAAATVAAFFLPRLFGRVDRSVEDRRRRAINLSNFANSNGLNLVSQLLSSYAVGDYRGVAHDARAVMDILGDTEQANEALEKFLLVQLDRKLRNAGGREQVLAYLEERLSVSIPRTSVVPKKAELVEKTNGSTEG